MSKQKHPSPDPGDTACSSLNLCCVLQCSALLPWQKSPHSNNLFQRRLKRDSAHAQKCCTCSVSSLQRPFQRDHHKDKREIREAPVPKMLAPRLLRRAVLTVPLVFVVALLLAEPVRSDQEAGTAIPAESRPCVDCHAFEFMQRALQDLKKTAYNLDTRVRKHSISFFFFFLMWKKMLWIKVNKVDGFCTRQSTVLSYLLR
uniref:NELL2-interacting cell ontogeny regulator 1 n=3 Tax=Telluraves TaxID=3073808 RepID=A0A8B9NFD7_9AVES